jgi:ferrous iron transport protein B
MISSPPHIKLQKIALLGNPNAGKSSLFNTLTGLNQHTGNYPGVTTDINVGKWKIAEGKTLELSDLPGIYSLFAKSEDERVVLNVILDKNNPSRPDLIIVVLDASNLKRSLMLMEQINSFDLPVIAVLNMNDIAESRGIKIDCTELQKLTGVKIIPINARTGKGREELAEQVNQNFTKKEKSEVQFEEDWQKELNSKIKLKNPLHARILISQYEHLSFLDDDDKAFLKSLHQKYALDTVQLQTEDSKKSLKQQGLLIKACVKTEKSKVSKTERTDKVLMHPVAGFIIFFGLLLLVFQAIFNLASYPMEWIDQGFGILTTWLSANLPESMLSDLFTEGIIAGIGGIVIFVPQIAILFALLTVLEESGYMSRVMFLTDKTMSRFGLNGKSIVPLISGAACAIPAIMATRSISNWKERLTTIMVTPLISCSARLPVYIIFISLVVPSYSVWGIFSLQSLVLTALYAGGFIAALLSAIVFNKILKQDNSSKSVFVMELPSYKLPQWRTVFINIYKKTGTFIFEAGKIIIAISIILWVLASYGPSGAMQTAEEEAIEIFESGTITQTSLDEIIASKQLEASYMGHIGHFIEPVIKPLGYDWKIGIALLASFAAREVFVSTMATIYSVGQADGAEETLLEKLKTEKNPETGELVFSTAVSFSLLIFYLFAMQCMATLAIVQRETKSWKWPLIQLVYMTLLAYFGAFITFQLLS